MPPNKTKPPKIDLTDDDFTCILTAAIRYTLGRETYMPMLVTDLGIVIDVRLLQFSKAPIPMLVTDSGIVTDVRLLQLSKRPLSMLVTESGIVIDARFVQLEKAL